MLGYLIPLQLLVLSGFRLAPALRPSTGSGQSNVRHDVPTVSNRTRRVAAHRLFVDGSFVTSNPEPNDVDAVVWLADDFVDRVSRGDSEAVELETMLLTRRPEEIFAAEDRWDWDAG